MALQVFTGSFAEPAITGSKIVTGVGFQPKALIIFSTDLTADGSTAGINQGVGFGISSSSRAAIGGAFDDGGSGAAVPWGAAQSAGQIIYVPTTAGALQISADLTSLDSDGFTLNFATVSVSAYIFNFIALGGLDLTNVFIKQFQTPASTGSVAYTGVGFKPDAIIVLSIGYDQAPPKVASTTNRYSLGFGVGTTGLSTGWEVDSNGTTTLTGRKQTTNIIETLGSGTGIRVEATLTSLDSDGFTLNYTNTSQANKYVWVLCLKGGKYATGVDTQKTSTGTKSTAGLGFTPAGIILQSFNNAANSAAQTQARYSLGAGSGSSARGCIWLSSRDAVTTTNTSENLDRANILRMMTENSGSPTTQAAGDLSSLDVAGFTINWGTADATAREFVYLAMGSSAGGNDWPILTNKSNFWGWRYSG